MVREFFDGALLELKEKPEASTLTLVRSPANKQLLQIRRQFIYFNVLAPAIYYLDQVSIQHSGRHINTIATSLPLPRPGFHQLATPLLKFLPFLEHKLIS